MTKEKNKNDNILFVFIFPITISCRARAGPEKLSASSPFFNHIASVALDGRGGYGLNKFEFCSGGNDYRTPFSITNRLDLSLILLKLIYSFLVISLVNNNL